MTEEPLGVCRTADDLRAVLRARFQELGVSFETVDHIAGLPTRYTAKVLGLQPNRGFGQISLDALLGAAGIKLIAVSDSEALDRVRGRLEPLQRVDCGKARRKRILIRFTPDFMRKIGRLGGRKRHAIALEKRRRSEIYRANALKRWQRPKATEAAAQQSSPCEKIELAAGVVWCADGES
jgi:hypothetical protein